MPGQTGHPRDERATGSPVISGTRWFDRDNSLVVLRIECPLTFDEVVAALYTTAEPDDLTTDEDLCGTVAVALLIDGIPGLRKRAENLRLDERRGAIESPAFLALCRQRATALTGH